LDGDRECSRTVQRLKRRGGIVFVGGIERVLGIVLVGRIEGIVGVVLVDGICWIARIELIDRIERPLRSLRKCLSLRITTLPGQPQSKSV